MTDGKYFYISLGARLQGNEKSIVFLVTPRISDLAKKAA
jgi:hypothetical protein